MAEQFNGNGKGTPLECPFDKRYPSQLYRDDHFFMTLVYNLAIDAWRAGEVPIGAVVELDGEIIGKAHNRVESTKDPTAHAEMLAVTAAAHAVGDWRLNGATLYVSKEPCPMCSGAMIMSRISRVVYAVRDPKMGCLGGATDVSALPRINHHVQIDSGIMEEECKELLRAFFSLRRRPSDSSEPSP